MCGVDFLSPQEVTLLWELQYHCKISDKTHSCFTTTSLSEWLVRVEKESPPYACFLFPFLLRKLSLCNHVLSECSLTLSLHKLFLSQPGNARQIWEKVKCHSTCPSPDSYDKWFYFLVWYSPTLVFGSIHPSFSSVCVALSRVTSSFTSMEPVAFHSTLQSRCFYPQFTAAGPRTEQPAPIQASEMSLFGVFVLVSSCWVPNIVSAVSTFKSQLKLTPATAEWTQYPSKFGHRWAALDTQNIRNSSKRPSCTKSEDLPSFLRK